VIGEKSPKRFWRSNNAQRKGISKSCFSKTKRLCGKTS